MHFYTIAINITLKIKDIRYQMMIKVVVRFRETY